MLRTLLAVLLWRFLPAVDGVLDCSTQKTSSGDGSVFCNAVILGGGWTLYLVDGQGQHKNALQQGQNAEGYSTWYGSGSVSDTSPRLAGGYKLSENTFDSYGFDEVLCMIGDGAGKGNWVRVRQTKDGKMTGGKFKSAQAYAVNALFPSDADGYYLEQGEQEEKIVRTLFRTDVDSSDNKHGPFFHDVWGQAYNWMWTNHGGSGDQRKGTIPGSTVSTTDAVWWLFGRKSKCPSAYSMSQLDNFSCLRNCYDVGSTSGDATTYCNVEVLGGGWTLYLVDGETQMKSALRLGQNPVGFSTWYSSAPSDSKPRATGGYKMSEGLFDAYGFTEVLMLIGQGPNAGNWVRVRLTKDSEVSGARIKSEQAYAVHSIAPQGAGYILEYGNGVNNVISTESIERSESAGYKKHGPFMWDPFDASYGWMWTDWSGTTDTRKGTIPGSNNPDPRDVWYLFGRNPAMRLDPTAEPTMIPSPSPSAVPTYEPSIAPTAKPTFSPTEAPSPSPSAAPTWKPSERPTAQPTFSPSQKPTPRPSSLPGNPTMTPTISQAPSPVPTASPSATPTLSPTLVPTTAGAHPVPAPAPAPAPVPVPTLAPAPSGSAPAPSPNNPSGSSPPSAASNPSSSVAPTANATGDGALRSSNDSGDDENQGPMYLIPIAIFLVCCCIPLFVGYYYYKNQSNLKKDSENSDIAEEKDSNAEKEDKDKDKDTELGEGKGEAEAVMTTNPLFKRDSAPRGVEQAGAVDRPSRRMSSKMTENPLMAAGGYGVGRAERRTSMGFKAKRSSMLMESITVTKPVVVMPDED